MSALRGFGLGRLAALAGIGIGLTAALVALTLNIGTQPKALLYANLDLKEASAVVQALEQAGIKYEAQGDGSTIMVPRDAVASTRLMIASKSLVSSGSIGYEIFDQGATLGQTDFVQQLNRQRALEGELARTIKSIDGVTSVRVHLNLPRRQLFEQDAAPATASVTIGVGGRKPSDEQVQAVQSLVASSVPGLKAEQVAVIDQHSGKALSTGGDGSMAGKLADDRKSEIERRMAARIKELVEGIVGPGRARVEVSADIDMAQVTEQKTVFDPEGQVVVSEQTGEETAKENQPDGASSVSATGNIPGAATGAGGSLTTSDTGRQESTTNYANSQTVTTEVRQPGAVKQISVAVAVDGVTAPGEGGKPGAWTPRTEKERAELEELVKAAVGFDAARGDTVKVTNVRFAREAIDEAGVTAKAGLLSGFDKNDIMRAIELGIMAILGILLMLFGVRPLLKGLTGGGGGGGMLPALSGAGGGVTTRLVSTSDGGTMQIAVDPQTGEPLALPGPDMDQRIDIARIEGQVRASSVKRVSDFVDKHPDESVSILRSWLHETA